MLNFHTKNSSEYTIFVGKTNLYAIRVMSSIDKANYICFKRTLNNASKKVVNTSILNKVKYIDLNNLL